MSQTALTAIEYIAVAAIVIVFMITTSANIRAELSNRGNNRADVALQKAQEARAEAARQLVEAEQLAARFREHRRWIEENPEEFRAALLTQLTATDQ